MHSLGLKMTFLYLILIFCSLGNAVNLPIKSSPITFAYSEDNPDFWRPTTAQATVVANQDGVREFQFLVDGETVKTILDYHLRGRFAAIESINLYAFTHYGQIAVRRRFGLDAYSGQSAHPNRSHRAHASGA